MLVTISDDRHEITQKKVIASVKAEEPGHITKYFVEIKGRSFPITQVFAKALGIPKPEVNTNTAYRTLKKLGFQIQEKKEG